jgi:hypothetical protein
MDKSQKVSEFKDFKFGACACIMPSDASRLAAIDLPFLSPYFMMPIAEIPIPISLLPKLVSMIGQAYLALIWRMNLF